MRVTTRLLLVWLLLCPGFAQADVDSAAPPPANPKQNFGAPIIVGTVNDSFPYSYREGTGPLKGFIVELMDAVARVMDLRIERVEGTSREIQQRFAQGEFDMLQALSQTTDREAYTEFSVPFLDLQGSIFTRVDHPGLNTIQDFAGKPFAIIGRDSIGEHFFRQQGIAIVPVYVSSTQQGLELVRNGRCAGVFGSRLTALSTIERWGWTDVEQFGAPLSDFDIRHCFAVHRGNAVLLARLNEGLAILHRSGEFNRIYQHWFGHLGSPLISRTTVVRVAFSVLGFALLVAIWAALQQRRLRKRLASQAAELTRQDAILRALYDNLPVAILVLENDPTGERVLTLNRPAEVACGVSAAEAAGRPLTSLPLQPDWRFALQDLLSRGRESTQLIREERTLSQSRRRLVFTLVPMGTASPDRRRFCILVEDITERRTLDEEIAQSRRLRAVGELVGGIAHEFNNLLTPAAIQVSLIKLEWAHDPKLVEEIQVIADVTKRASELTRRLLTFGRKNDTEIESVKLVDAVQSCFALLRLTIDRRIVWQQEIQPDLPPLQFNLTDLNQIILNLVINARDTLLEKLSRQPGDWTPTIRIEASFLPADALGRLDGLPSRRQILGWQRLTVRDNGLGIPPEVRERIFEPFYTTKPVGKGTGLGLATVWHLVTESSGRIEVESAVGEGSAFHVYLPLLPAEAVTTATTLQSSHEGNRGRIFLAEDDPGVAKAIQACLQREHHTVTHRPDGAIAWQHLQEHLADYDLLILDVNMPGLDGIELSQRIRRLGSYRGRMMIISGRLSSNELRQIAETGIDCVLNKPFEFAELIGAVRDCLRAGPR